MSEIDEKPPSPGEVAAELAELGVMLAEVWWRGAGRVAEVGMVEPARAAARLVGLVTGQTAARLGEVARPAATAPRRVVSGEVRQNRARPSNLHDRGAELLRRSADVSDLQAEAEQHPAYYRILDELAPDEARILRLLATSGAQPIVDVRSGLPGGGRLIASSLTMVCADAGCRFPERFRIYLDNLVRLGLVAVRPEPISDPLRYQLLEAQPGVGEALSEAGRLGRTVRRSLELTSFGEGFCSQALPSQGVDR